MRLVPYAEDHRDLTLALESDPRVMGHLGGVSTPEVAERVHRWRVEAPARGDLFVGVVPDGATAPVGLLGVWRSEIGDDTVYELGAMILPDFQAQGVASGAFYLLLPQVRAAGITRLDSFPGVDNVASNAILQRIGFVRVGERDLDYEGRSLRCAHWTRDV
ncbi:GNAT family N-acetyltransferase [Jidongwangia harbinensis]|uniref:GNAT family N-acetyltransferase n=1 Tax=Jidongwangia harbinensis TaxID=2878561 RepID=UPI001CDA2D25|nr:GNAT family N-acetyltransferase [Jidongwangia harbinensis]MCA2214235.1 GNAT family N-acetyltransferase [Jidongwangia harbinensis]